VAIIISANWTKWIAFEIAFVHVSVCLSVCVHFAWRRCALQRALFSYIIIIILTPGSKGSRGGGLKKIQSKAGMAIGPVDPRKRGRAKAPS